MSHLSYEESKKLVLKGLIILGIITLVEVFIALLGKGYVIHDYHLPRWIMYIAMISMSLYKAYFIVYYFMHMKYEVPGLVKSVLLPTTLLLWAVISFFSEGKNWREWRALKNDRPIAAFETGKIHDEHGDEHKESHPASMSSDTLQNETEKMKIEEEHSENHH
ncbi:MAG: cytochrome C oxidase subunit IV family protein [Saprospiraceae bacterium]